MNAPIITSIVTNVYKQFPVTLNCHKTPHRYFTLCVNNWLIHWLIDKHDRLTNWSVLFVCTYSDGRRSYTTQCSALIPTKTNPNPNTTTPRLQARRHVGEEHRGMCPLLRAVTHYCLSVRAHCTSCLFLPRVTFVK